jgi:cytochrome c oxidase accessory protein FixG
MHEGPLEHATAFGIVAFLTLALWFCFGYFREQFCIIMCPYGRLQSALTDDDTINIGYDARRGEPRGTKGKAEGDCIDCHRCVQVCPTGIDIREGLQLECIGCTACIDACDDVMTRIDRPKGLIRYDSFNGFAGRGHRWLRPRVYAYAVFAVLGAASLLALTAMKLRPFHLTVTHAGAVGFLVDESSVRNIYKLRLINKRNEPVTLTIRLGEGTPEGYQISGGDAVFKLDAHEEMVRSCIVEIPISSYKGITDVVFEVSSDKGEAKIERPTSFRGPNPQSFKPQTPLP